LDQGRGEEARHVDSHHDVRIGPRQIEQGRVGRAQRQQGGQEEQNGTDTLSQGTFEVDNVPPPICMNGIDDDGDTFFDMADPDCGPSFGTSENPVVTLLAEDFNGGLPASDPQGSGTARRTMKGIVQHVSTNVFHPGDTGFPTGDDLDETKVNYVLRKIWENSSGNVDLIVVGGFQM